MIDISTEAKMLLMDNRTTLFKADLILGGQYPSAVGANLDIHEDGQEEDFSINAKTTSVYYIGTAQGFDVSQIPQSLMEKYQYIIFSMYLDVESLSNSAQLKMGYVGQKDGVMWAWRMDEDNAANLELGSKRYFGAFETEDVISLTFDASATLFTAFRVSENVTLESTIGMVMCELNNTGVPSVYANSYVAGGGSYDDFLTPVTLSLTGDDVMANTVAFSDSTSSSGSFDIGAAIINSLSLTLNNYDDRFSMYDFTGAKIRPYIGIPLETTEWITKGYYTVDKPTSIGNTIPLTMLDNMSKFEKPYREVAQTFPATISQILQSICIYCGVVLDNTTFTNSTLSIPSRPEDENLSCLDMVSAIAQLAGCYARINNQGYLQMMWYDTEAFNDDSEDCDGGTFLTNTTPYSDGDSVDGGDFSYDGTEDSADGGSFTYGDYFSCYAFSSFSIGTDDITITGIKVTVDSDNYYAVGEDGYVLELSSNPLITAENMESVAQFLGNKIIGMKFRPFNVSALSDPTVEAGDAIRLADRKGNYYDSFVTNCNYKFGNYESFACNAESASQRNATNYSPLTKAVEQARKDTQKALSTYDEAVKNMSSLQSNALGFYETFTTELDGSRISYMHDHPTLADSSIIWKKSVSGMFVSTDGGVTWGGMTADLNIVAKVLNVIGINADWINAGTITGRAISGGTINGATINSPGSGHSVSISGGKLTVNNDANNFLNVNQGDGTFAIGGKTFATYNGSVYYGDYETIYIGKAAQDAGAGSDERLKHDIQTLDSNLSKSIIMETRPVEFLYNEQKNEHGKRYGVIAQELREILDENNVGEANLEYVRHDGYHTVEYKEFIAHLINVAQLQQTEIYELKRQVKILMEKVGG